MSSDGGATTAAHSPVAGGRARRRFDEAFLRRLERLTLQIRVTRSGGQTGARRAAIKGPGLEFADHRPYGPGDDIRHLDWPLYARLERLFVKVHEAEHEAAIHLVVDRSRSMGFGAPDTKLDFALRLAGAIGYVGLAGFDRASFVAVDTEPAARFGPVRGKAQAHALFGALERIELGGGTDLLRSLETVARAMRPGLAVVVSDFLDATGWRDGLRALRAARFEVFALQVLAPEDVDPRLEGELSLVDAETGETLALTINDAVRERYRAALAEHCGAIERFCAERRIGYLRAVTDTPFEDLVLTTLRRAPLFR